MSDRGLGPEVHAPYLGKVPGRSFAVLPDYLRTGRLLAEPPKDQPRLADPPMRSGGRLVAMSVGEELLEQRRQRRRAGDPRLSPEGREILRRLVSGDLTGEFQAALDAVNVADPLLGGGPDPDTDPRATDLPTAVQ